jgi:hypothetical protein
LKFFADLANRNGFFPLSIEGTEVTSKKTLSAARVNNHCDGVSLCVADLLSFTEVLGYSLPLFFANQLAAGLIKMGIAFLICP